MVCGLWTVVPNSARDCDEAVTGRKWARPDESLAFRFWCFYALLWCIMSDLRSCGGVGYAYLVRVMVRIRVRVRVRVLK